MSRKTDASVVARTIGIDTGKNTLHLIGLDDKGAIVLREKLTRGRIADQLSIDRVRQEADIRPALLRMLNGRALVAAGGTAGTVA